MLGLARHGSYMSRAEEWHLTFRVQSGKRRLHDSFVRVQLRRQRVLLPGILFSNPHGHFCSLSETALPEPACRQWSTSNRILDLAAELDHGVHVRRFGLPWICVSARKLGTLHSNPRDDTDEASSGST